MEVYLDNSATTKMCSQAKEKLLEAIDNSWGNPSSLHRKGIEADMLLLCARRAVAKALSADEKEVVFTSGGTEGNNLAIFGAAHQNRRKGNRVITTKIEHPSVMKAFERLSEEGFEVIYIGTDSFGHLDMNELENAVDESFMPLIRDGERVFTPVNFFAPDVLNSATYTVLTNFNEKNIDWCRIVCTCNFG